MTTYYQLNKEACIKRSIKYYYKHQKIINNRRRRIKYYCLTCKKNVRLSDKSTHFKSQIHKKNIKDRFTIYFN